MSYKIYLDKEEIFECEASIKNASYKNSSARLIIESEDINLVFYGNVDKDTISVPIKNLKKYFTEKDSAKIKLVRARFYYKIVYESFHQRDKTDVVCCRITDDII